MAQHLGRYRARQCPVVVGPEAGEHARPGLFQRFATPQDGIEQAQRGLACGDTGWERMIRQAANIQS